MCVCLCVWVTERERGGEINLLFEKHHRFKYQRKNSCKIIKERHFCDFCLILMSFSCEMHHTSLSKYLPHEMMSKRDLFSGLWTHSVIKHHKKSLFDKNLNGQGDKTVGSLLLRATTHPPQGNLNKVTELFCKFWHPRTMHLWDEGMSCEQRKKNKKKQGGYTDTPTWDGAGEPLTLIRPLVLWRYTAWEGFCFEYGSSASSGKTVHWANSTIQWTDIKKTLSFLVSL